MNANDFSSLSAESEISSLARISLEELTYNEFHANVSNELNGAEMLETN